MHGSKLAKFWGWVLLECESRPARCMAAGDLFKTGKTACLLYGRGESFCIGCLFSLVVISLSCRLSLSFALQ